MDAEEIAALAAGLGKAMADGLAANEAAREEKAAAEKEARAASAEAKRIAEKRSKALRRVTDLFVHEQESARRSATSAVASYCSNARADVLEPLKKDPRMPRSINYLERYGALVSMDDRSAVLKRLKATLDLADEILDTAGEVDAQSALIEAADNYVQKVLLLDGIQVADAGCLAEDEEFDEEPFLSAESTPSEIAKAIEAAFTGALGDLPSIEVREFEKTEASKVRENAINEQIEAAVKAATKAAMAIKRSRAESVAGSVFAVERPAGFDGEILLKATKDPAQVKLLATEVHKSFGTFKQVVADNGLFAAFASENSYGACKGIHFDWWWDDFFDDEYFGEKPGRKVYDDIPTDVEEDKGGDSLEKSIERMRGFNKQKYWGLLDDDFSQHVDAFWYGFKKLMENVNSLFELDSRAFGKYCNQVSRSVQSSAGDLGERMDDSQLSAFATRLAHFELRTLVIVRALAKNR